MARDLGGHNTRLSALFVAAILIPGSFLAYFSIQNVGSQKELAEKRLQEEEERLAAGLGTFLRDELVRTATAFLTAADTDNPDLRDTRTPGEDAILRGPCVCPGRRRAFPVASIRRDWHCG